MAKRHIRYKSTANSPCVSCKKSVLFAVEGPGKYSVLLWTYHEGILDILAVRVTLKCLVSGEVCLAVLNVEAVGVRDSAVVLRDRCTVRGQTKCISNNAELVTQTCCFQIPAKASEAYSFSCIGSDYTYR